MGIKIQRQVTWQGYVYLLAVVILAGGCSSGQKAMKKDPGLKDSDIIPTWYVKGENTFSDTLKYVAYATALDSDSAMAVEKAEDRARADLKSAVSSKLEEIRKKAGRKISSLNNLPFIITLRNAEPDLEKVINVTEHSAEKQADYEGFRGFVKVSAAKKELIAELDRSMSSQAQNWKAMKESSAFSEF